MNKLEKLKEQYKDDKLSDIEKESIQDEIDKEENLKYIVLSNGSRVKLEKESNEYRLEGWTPSGGLAKLDSEYTQVMYR